MTDIVKVDFTDGDVIEGAEIKGCPICGRKGVRVKSMHSDTVMFEHVIIWDKDKKRSRLSIIDGCFRQANRVYKFKP